MEQFFIHLDVVFGLAIYLLPSMVAVRRHHRYQSGIIALNVLLGWTVICWAVAIVWALTDQGDPRERWLEERARHP
jgi:hypothetical protein